MIPDELNPDHIKRMLKHLQNLDAPDGEEKTPPKPIKPDYEPEQKYGSHHDIAEHRRYGDTMDDY